jgi:hypothetical protein
MGSAKIRSAAAPAAPAAAHRAAKGTVSPMLRSAGAAATAPARATPPGNQEVQRVARASVTPGGASHRTGILPTTPTLGRRSDAYERHADAVAHMAAGSQRLPFVTRGQARARSDAGASGGATLPFGLRRRVESLTGSDLGDVRVHDGPASRHTAAALGARAFTVGRNIHLGTGLGRNDTRLLAHEATHVAQQARDPRAPAVQLDATNQSLTPGYAAALDDGSLMDELQAAETVLRANPASDPTHQAIAGNVAVLRTEYFSRHPGSKAEAMPTPPPPALPRVTQIPAGGTDVGRVGVVSWDGEDQLKLRTSPDTVSVNIVTTLPFSSRLQVIKSFPGDWYFVATASGDLGYVASNYVLMNAPEPNAVLHRVTPGVSGTAIGIAERYYAEYARDWGQDLRFYVNVLAWANHISVPDTTTGWRQVHFRAGQLIWVPSQRFAYSLKGAVNSGSYSWNAADAIGIAGFLDRIEQLWDDYHLAVRYSDEFAVAALARHVEQSARGMVEGLVQMIVIAVAILAITTAVGAILGGIFGVGAGAAPGAAAGFEVGMVIIEWLGLAMLVVWIAQSLIQVGAAFGTFLATVWGAHGDRDVLRRAGFEWADANALLIAKILEGLLMLVMARGLPKGLEALRGTRLGAALGESRAVSWLTERSANIEAGRSPLPGPSTVLGRIRGTGPGQAEPAPIVQRGNAAAFHDLPVARLPRNLPEGHFWMRSADGTQWVLMRRTGAAPAPFELTVSADGAGNINYVMRTGNRMIQSDAVTQTGTAYSGQRLPNDLAGTGPDNPYLDPVSNVPWDKGHGVDYVDTLEGPGVHNTSIDPANFTPQASWWNQGPRNSLVGRIRDGHAPSGRTGGGGYREMAIYPDNPPVTADGTPIPSEFIFVEATRAGAPVRAWRIPNIQGAAGRAITAIDPMAIPLADVPPVMLRSGVPLAGPGGSGAVYSPGLIFGMPGAQEDSSGTAAVCDVPASVSVDEPVCRP